MCNANASRQDKRWRGLKTWAAWEVLLLSALVSATSFALTRDHYMERLRATVPFVFPAEQELAPIMNRFGPGRYSRNGEEWIIRDYFQDRRDGVFLDVGANHYRAESNTYYLEKELGWSGVAVDALLEFAADYERYRPRTRFVTAFASDVEHGSATLFVPPHNTLVASADQAFTERQQSRGEPRTVPTTTLNAILRDAGIEHIDFLSMDIELAEPQALAGFDIERFRPALVCIEAHPEVRDQILRYFALHGYLVVGKYLRIDPLNLYFEEL